MPDDSVYQHPPFIDADTSWCASHILHVTHAPSAPGHLAALLRNPLWLLRRVVSPFNKIKQKFKAGFWKQRCPERALILFASCAQPIISAKVELCLAVRHHLVRWLPLQFCELFFRYCCSCWGGCQVVTKREAGKRWSITKCFSLTFTSFPSRSPSLRSSPTHTSRWSGKLSDKVALGRLTRTRISSLSGNGGTSHWLSLATSATYWSDGRTLKMTSWYLYWPSSCLSLITMSKNLVIPLLSTPSFTSWLWLLIYSICKLLAIIQKCVSCVSLRTGTRGENKPAGKVS